MEFSPLSVDVNAQWTKATYAGVVGQGQDLPKNFEHLIFPQALHDIVVGKGTCPYVSPIGVKEGEPAILFTLRKIQSLNESIKFTLIGKFQFGHLKIDFVRTFFYDLQLTGAWKLGLMDGRHLLIKFSNEEDYARVFAKQTLLVAGTLMKLLKWTPSFDPSKDPPIVRIWFKLPNLPIQYYHQNVLFNNGKTLDYPLKVDAPTYNLTRPTRARVLVERDITLLDVKRVWIGTQEERFWQNTVMEKRQLFCPHCRMFGHNLEKCYRLHPPSKKVAAPLKVTQGGVEPSLDKKKRRSTEDASNIITRGNE
ncbi:uncharacterized protein LOC110039088 [Phalaenopsis equestris]|uniref:uncharacterized protein LOC110039088 n=1 Tax=Phalaenopsis equestris TaxID=78828 RepID=UPI0009E1BD54|nr:uncharacterized protein LOC110039088 [Phalaenopsis equestris]